ncbi:hypothetical protein BJ875DRAFT_168895 [Amylocarpus encephaloides]|uniref:Uncharacterized protein n=1 Tax=Amylocarpus encephaloides TaxID=45428 RepID=A0A9P8C185_9HELO|nr:hypothetical protein BJ875DRAFT_168895 [Amylocarpus encephaloides]
MSGLGYNRVNPFSPLGDMRSGGGAASASTGPVYYDSPQAYQQQWGAYHGDLGSPEIELMQSRPSIGQHMSSTSSGHEAGPTLFPPNSIDSTPRIDSERQSFLPNFQDPLGRLDTTLNAHDVPYKDHSSRQLKHILLGMSTRWVFTVLLCAAYAVSTIQWKKRGPQTPNEKKMFNAIITGISIALGLNIASAFKDIALNMRWVILGMKKRSLKEVDLILSADSMLKIFRLAIVSKRPLVIIACLAWLFINILAQSGLAMISLTFSWETGNNSVSIRPGEVTAPNMDHFYSYSASVMSDPSNITTQDEMYTAHLYGGLPTNYGVNFSGTAPVPGQLYTSRDSFVFWNNRTTQNQMEYYFYDSPPASINLWSSYATVTSRMVAAEYKCKSYQVTGNGTGNSTNIIVEDVGDVFISHKSANSITFFTEKETNTTNNQCGSPRCSIVEAFEASDTDPWYYKCNITVTPTANDPDNITYISDKMAAIAGSAIAQIGYTDDGQEAQIYPKGSYWGEPVGGDESAIGSLIATYALGSLAMAAIYNPPRTHWGMAPTQGNLLVVGHRYFFYIILGLIAACHFLFLLIVAVLANKAKIGPDSHLEMSLLLRPIAESLEGLRSNGKDTKAYQLAVESTKARYEKQENERWVLNTS